MTRRAARSAAWLLGLLAAGVSLRLAASGELAAPPLGALDELTDWVAARSPIAAAVALVRLLAELGVWYVLGVSTLHTAAELARVAGGHRLADALSLPGVRRLVRAGLGLGLAAASTVSQGGAAPRPGTAAMVPTPESVAAPAGAPVAEGGVARAVPEPRGTATMRPVATPEPTITPVSAPAPPATWTVHAGESLWSIAEEVLADAWRRPPTDDEVAPYWRALVAANRHRLVDPADPGLIHPGQVFEVPPVSSPVG